MIDAAVSPGFLYRARAFDTPVDPFTTDGPGFRHDDDLGLLVSHDDGTIVARGPFATLAADHPTAPVIDLRDGILLPGLVDTHVHFPQVRVIGALGMPLLEWLERCALPEEQHLASPAYAATIAGEFVAGLISAGTTTSLVFGSHFASAVDALFAEAERYGLRVTSGLVVSDRMLPEPLLTTPERAHDEAVDLALALARSGTAALRRDAPLLAVGVGPDPRRVPRGAGDGRRRLLHLARQREPGRGRHRGGPVPRPRALRRHLRPPRAPRPALGAGPRRAPHRPRARRDGGPRDVGGVLPDQQRGARLGPVPAAPPPRCRRTRRARQRRRRRHRVLDLQGGPAGLLPPAPAWVRTGCRSVPGTCST